MKRIVFTLIVLFSLLTGISAQITWIGGGGDIYGQLRSNWSGNAVPGNSDDVLINVPVTITLDVSPNINSLRITSTVTLASSVSQTILLNSTASSPKGLQIDLGGTLTLDCTNPNPIGPNNLILSLTGT